MPNGGPNSLSDEPPGAARAEASPVASTAPEAPARLPVPKAKANWLQSIERKRGTVAKAGRQKSNAVKASVFSLHNFSWDNGSLHLGGAAFKSANKSFLA
jgi:hypothetical protein